MPCQFCQVPDFKCNLQQYSFFSKVPVCTQNPQDLDEPYFFLYYPRPMYLRKIGTTQFCPFDCFTKPKNEAMLTKPQKLLINPYEVSDKSAWRRWKIYMKTIQNPHNNCNIAAWTWYHIHMKMVTNSNEDGDQARWRWCKISTKMVTNQHKDGDIST